MDVQNTPNQIPVLRKQNLQSLVCAMIDEYGNEIVITEEMIQNACQEFEQRPVKSCTQD